MRVNAKYSSLGVTFLLNSVVSSALGEITARANKKTTATP